MRTNYEPPTKERPDKMTSFMGWNGFILHHGSPEQRLGLTRLKTQRDDIEAWVMTAHVPYQFGLPIYHHSKHAEDFPFSKVSSFSKTRRAPSRRP
jgi:hypothetical protein